MKKIIQLMLCLWVAGNAMGQSDRDLKRWVREIESNSEKFLSASGVGKTEAEAHNSALAALVNQISVDVSSGFRQEDIEVRTGHDISSTSKVESIIRTYSRMTLKNVEYRVLKRTPQQTEVFCYMAREDLEKIFSEREKRVGLYVSQGWEAERQRKVDDALTFYYWGYCLLKTLPSAHDLRGIVGGHEEGYWQWIPRQIKKVMDALDTKIAKWDGNEADLLINFNDAPVTSLQFQVYNGSQWGRIYKAKDGRAHVFLPETVTKKSGIQIAYAYERIGEAQTEDEDVLTVLQTLKNPFGKDIIVTSDDKDEEDNAATQSKNETYDNVEAVTLGTSTEQKEVEKQFRQLQKEASEAVNSLLVKNTKSMHQTVRALVEAIKKGEYATVRNNFTESGYLMFDSLIHYGRARIIGNPQYSFYEMNDKVVCRSIPMSFSFPTSKQCFNDDVTLTFNAEGKIEAVAFALDQIARNDIFQTTWPDNVKMVIANFLENYQTAFALKRLDYIEQLFHDDAIIITGTVLKKPKMVMENQKALMSKPSVKYTQHSKEKYIENLRTCFQKNEFVHLRFTETDFRASNNKANGELYGIQIHQNYASSSYSDDGYLFLLVDFNKAEQPLILLRTWQPERDPGIYKSAADRMRREGTRNFGLYHMGYF